MSPRLPHAQAPREDATPARPTAPVGVSRLVDWRASLRRADHACCCPGVPSVVVIMPPTAERLHPVDLLLCRHHYRASREALAAAGAVILSTDGTPLTESRREAYAAR